MQKNKYLIHLIDHGRSFPGRYVWSAKTLQEEREKYRLEKEIYKWAMQFVTSKELSSFAQKIISLENEKIYEIIQSIPQDWNVSNKDRYEKG